MDTQERKIAALDQLAAIAHRDPITHRAWLSLIDSVDDPPLPDGPHPSMYYILATTLRTLGLENPRPEDMPKRWAKTPLGNLFLRRWLADHGDEYITPSEAARRAGATVQNIRQWANFGRITTIPNPDPPAASLTYFVNAASLDRFLSEREQREDEQ